MEVSSAALDDDVDGRATSLALLCVEGVGGDVDCLDGVCSRNIGDEVGQPTVCINRAIDAGRVSHVFNAVDVDRHGARWIRRSRVLLNYVSWPGDWGKEGLKIAPL